MSKLIEDLKAAGWVETTIGECQTEEEILINMPYDIPRAVTIYRFEKRFNQVRTRDGKSWPEEIPVLRAPRDTMTENQKPTEKRIITDLKAAGWVETTIGECQAGEKILINMPYHIPKVLTIYRVEEHLNQVRTRGGMSWSEEIPVLRAPRDTIN